MSNGSSLKLKLRFIDLRSSIVSIRDSDLDASTGDQDGIAVALNGFSKPPLGDGADSFPYSHLGLGGEE
eukprot:2360892-Amphidinium_carterae.1